VTPDLLVAGGVTHADDAGLEIARSPGDEAPVRLLYRAAEAEHSYPVRIEPRLSAYLRRTDHGYVAVVPTLNGLGYGDTQESALRALGDSIEQYLEFLREDSPRLAPSLAHHAAYVALLDVPRGAWLASVTDASTLE